MKVEKARGNIQNNNEPLKMIDKRAFGITLQVDRIFTATGNLLLSSFFEY